MNAALEWVKANVFIVVFIALMIAAMIALPLFSSRMNASVRDVVKQRVQHFSQLSQLERSEILPGHTGVPNDETIRRYQEVASLIADDASRVHRAAIEHNRKGRGVLMENVFPEPPQALREVVPMQFHERLAAAYAQLLAEVRAGMPPDLENLRQDLTLVHNQFINQDLKKDLSEQLTEEEQRQLKEKLSSARLSMYAEAAENLGLYVSPQALYIPQWNQANPPSVGELFQWQWQYWVASDVLHSLHAANRDHRTVLTAPVKHVKVLYVSGLPAPAGASAGGPAGGRGVGVGGFGGGAADMNGSTHDSGGAQAAGGIPANPKIPVPRDFKVSHTGRITNPLYDVIYVDLHMVVEASRLSQVLDELAKYNFMTVTSMKLTASDPYAALPQGFFYGPEPVTEVELRLETIWFREWTQEFMPASIKQALKIPLPSAGAPVDPSLM